MSEGPLSRYRALVESGELIADPVQAKAAEKLQDLSDALADYRPRTGASGWKARFRLPARKPREASDPAPPQGMYLCGDVGRGKSLLMSLFHETVPVADKRRVHFHVFMRDVHAALNRVRRQRRHDDPIPPVADEIVARSWLLCLDELEIRDIADAMIVGRLFEALFARGAVVVTTSNRAPQDLYKNGLQRDRFLPFIDLIAARLEVLALDAATDYRLGRDAGETVYFTPLNDKARQGMDEAYDRVTGHCVTSPHTLSHQGREIAVPRACAEVARFGFSDLCERPLAASDYLEIARHFEILFIDDIPVLKPEKRDAARRFVLLIDTLYESGTRLYCSAAAPPELLYPYGDGAFEFNRTISRLMEMQAADWPSAPQWRTESDLDGPGSVFSGG